MAPPKKSRTDVGRCSSTTTQPVLCEWEQISGVCTSRVLSDEHTQNHKRGAKDRRLHGSPCPGPELFSQAKELEPEQKQLNYSLIQPGLSQRHAAWGAQRTTDRHRVFILP